MNRERLRQARRLFQQLEQRGVADATHPHSGDCLIAWGELLKDLQGGIRALDLKSWLVLEPVVVALGLSTPWASSELAISVTDLATFFNITEREAFFIVGPLRTSVFAYAVGRIQAILEHASEQAQERLSVRQHTELTKAIALGSLNRPLAVGQQTQERAERLDRLVTLGTEADLSSHRNSAPRTRMNTCLDDLLSGRSGTRPRKRVNRAL